MPISGHPAACLQLLSQLYDLMKLEFPLAGHCVFLIRKLVITVQTLWVDPYRGLRTLRHDLTLDRGLSFEAACRRLEHERKEGDRCWPPTLSLVR